VEDRRNELPRMGSGWEGEVKEGASPLNSNWMHE